MDECCDIYSYEGVLEAIGSCSRCEVSSENVPAKHQRGQAQPNNGSSSKQKPLTEREKKIQLGKVKPLSSEEAIKLSSVSTAAPAKSSGRSNTLSKKSKTSCPEESPLDTSAAPPNVPTIAVRANRQRHGTSSQINAPPTRQQFVKEARGKVAMQSSVKEHKMEHFKQKSAMVAPTKMAAASMVIKDTIRTPPPRESFTVEKDTIRTSPLKSGGVASPYTVPRTEHTSANMKSVIYVSAGDQFLSSPLSTYFWKGSLKLKNNAKFEEIQIQAHHPTRVNEKAYEFSKKLPAVLNFELIHQKGILVKVFAGHIPGQNDIALYFKPSNEKRNGSYVSFMEHILSNNLALRTEIDGMELLVFASNALRPDCQKYEGSYFLWGMFYRKMVIKAAAGPLDLNADQSQEDNDDIDMMVGLDVGIKEIVKNTHKLRVQTPPRDKKIGGGGDVPPGFESTPRLRVQTPRAKKISGDAPPDFERRPRLRVQALRDKKIGGGDDVPSGFDSTPRLRVQTPRDKKVSGGAPPGFERRIG